MDKFWVTQDGKVLPNPATRAEVQEKYVDAGVDVQLMLASGEVQNDKWGPPKDHGFKRTPVVNLEDVKAEAQAIADRLGPLMPPVEEMDEDPGMYSVVWSAWLLKLRKKHPAAKIQIIYSHPDVRDSQKFEAVVSL